MDIALVDKVKEIRKVLEEKVALAMERIVEPCVLEHHLFRKLRFLLIQLEDDKLNFDF